MNWPESNDKLTCFIVDNLMTPGYMKSPGNTQSFVHANETADVQLGPFKHRRRGYLFALYDVARPSMLLPKELYEDVRVARGRVPSAVARR